MASLNDIEFYMIRDEVQRSMTEASQQELNSSYARAVGRKTEFLLKSFRAIQNEDHYYEVINNGKKKLILRFLASPKEFQINNGRVSGVIFEQNKLQGEMDKQVAI